jgi:hypothetical protein
VSTLSAPYLKSIVWHRRLVRSTAVPAAALAVVAVWLLADKAAGIDIHQPAFGSAAAQPLSVAFATLVAALAAVLGWALLALLERRSPRAARLWFRIAVATMLVSLAGPLAGHGISAGNRLALFCMHLAAATIIIALLYRTTTPLDAQAKRKHPR